MKKIALLIFWVLILVFAPRPAVSVEVVPYYNYQFTQGASISPDGDAGFLLNLSNDIGTIVMPADDHSIIGYYSFQYQGPGLKRQEGREFRERYLNHVFAGRHHWSLGDMTLQSQLSIMTERRRSGTNETWDSGLYNFNRYGGSSAVSLDLYGIYSTISLGYHYLTFPNYTDMLAEIRAGADASSTAGTQNHHSLRMAYRGEVKNNVFWLSFNPLFYTRQRVAVDRAQADGSFYSSTKQRELIMNMGGKRSEKLSDRVTIAPEIDLTLRYSNQNYQHFEEATSTTPVSFHDDFFDYMEPSLTLPVSVRLGSDWTYFASPSFSYRRYMHRNPRDSEGNFVGGEKQNRLLGVHTTGFRKQTGESSATVFFFTYQHQSSNMEFERYASYNYDGFSLGIRFHMEY